MTYDPIASALFVALILAALFVLLRDHRQHLWWIVPFAVASGLCIFWNAGVPKTMSNGMTAIDLDPIFPAAPIVAFVLTLYGVAMLGVTIKYHMKRRKLDSQPEIPTDGVWPPAPREGEK